MPGPSRPETDAVRVSDAPRDAALAFILATVACSPPSCCASAWAASLPDRITSPCISCRLLYVPPAPRPTELPSMDAASGFATIVVSRSSSSSATSASSTLMVLAGR